MVAFSSCFVHEPGSEAQREIDAPCGLNLNPTQLVNRLLAGTNEDHG